MPDRRLPDSHNSARVLPRLSLQASEFGPSRLAGGTVAEDEWGSPDAPGEKPSETRYRVALNATNGRGLKGTERLHSALSAN